jgi:hypothetical protein
MRAQTHQGAVFAARATRKSKTIGRWGITVTTKRRGDWEWDAATQSFVRVS